MGGVAVAKTALVPIPPAEHTLRAQRKGVEIPSRHLKHMLAHEECDPFRDRSVAVVTVGQHRPHQPVGSIAPAVQTVVTQGKAVTLARSQVTHRAARKRRDLCGIRAVNAVTVAQRTTALAPAEGAFGAECEGSLTTHGHCHESLVNGAATICYVYVRLTTEQQAQFAPSRSQEFDSCHFSVMFHTLFGTGVNGTPGRAAIEIQVTIGIGDGGLRRKGGGALMQRLPERGVRWPLDKREPRLLDTDHTPRPNGVSSQMKMVLTRLGDGSNMVVTGDLDQHDRGYEENGLKDFLQRINTDARGIAVVEFTKDEVERSPIVTEVLKTYK